MEIRNTGRFIIMTVILIAAMVSVIILFSGHPMGADFSKFKELTAKDLDNPAQFAEQRVAVRGKVEADDSSKLISVGKDKAYIGFIEKKRDLSGGKYAKDRYLSLAIIDFSVNLDGKKLPVRGQPQQIFEYVRLRKTNPADPTQYIDTIAQGQEYSIFGTLHQTAPGQVVLEPYRVTFEDIPQVKGRAEKDNKQIAFIQYLSIIAVIIIYVVGILKGGVFGPPLPEENGEAGDKGETAKEDEEKAEKPQEGDSE